MSRKIRVPKLQTSALPSPAWTFFLLVGTPAADRLKGWVTQAQAGFCEAPTAAAVWAQHGDALTAEAAAHDFAPFHATRKPPHGAGFEQWQQQFLAQHKY